MTDRATFYERIRPLFGGHINASQVAGMEAILNEWLHRDLKDMRWLAYMLATAFHETAKTMQAVEEWGKGHGKDYGLIDPTTNKMYYGRGLVQLTWARNYIYLGQVLGIDLYHNPELALQIDVAVSVMFEGMINGLFTGRKLGKYFTTTIDDPFNARRIINGTDKADLIEGYYNQFLKALI